MAIEVTESIEIAKPPEAVFDFIDDPRNYPQWVESAKSVDLASGGGFKAHLRPRGTMTGTPVQHERPSRHTTKLADDKYTVELRFTLSPTASGTRVEHTRALDTAKGGFGLMTGMVRKGTQKSVPRELDALKRAVEGSLP